MSIIILKLILALIAGVIGTAGIVSLGLVLVLFVACMRYITEDILRFAKREETYDSVFKLLLIISVILIAVLSFAFLF